MIYQVLIGELKLITNKFNNIQFNANKPHITYQKIEIINRIPTIILYL